MEIANNISFLLPILSIAREKILLNPKSFPQAVKNVVSKVSAIAGIDCLFNFGLSLTKNSVARC